MTTDAEAHLQRIKDKCKNSACEDLTIQKSKTFTVPLNAHCRKQRGWEGVYPTIRELLQNSFDYLELIGPDGFLSNTSEVLLTDNRLCFKIANERVLSIYLEVRGIPQHPPTHN